MPPVARYPSTSQAAVAILCPHCQALGGCLAENPIVLAGAAVVVADSVATSSLGARLQGVATLAVGLGEVQQQGGTVSADHTGAGEQQLGDTLGVAHEGGEAGGGDDGEHRSRVVVGGGGAPRCPNYSGSGVAVEGRQPVPEVALSGGRSRSRCPSIHAGDRAPAGESQWRAGAGRWCTCPSWGKRRWCRSSRSRSGSLR